MSREIIPDEMDQPSAPHIPPALYIKLGAAGRFERQSIDQGTVRLDYRDIPHDLPVAGRWDEIVQLYLQRGTDKGAATRHMSQIRHFYTAPQETLWATFAFGRLWWCHAKPEVKLLDDGTKVRDSVDGWHDMDAAGRLLDTRSLGGGILATRGFKGTIGRFGAEDALLRRINAEQRDEVVAAQKAASELESAVEQLISNLTWPDFEIFVDLIFRAAGYQRVSEVGGPLQRDIDLDLISPLTDEHVAVQVKATLTQRGLAAVVESLGRLPDYNRLYVAVHKYPEGLEATDEIVEVLARDRLASLAVRFGLVTWLIDRVG